MTVAQRTAIRCSSCGSDVRHVDDAYHLHIPDTWTLEDVHAWGEEGATIAWLERRGVQVTKRCVLCQAEEQAAPLDAGSHFPDGAGIR